MSEAVVSFYSFFPYIYCHIPSFILVFSVLFLLSQEFWIGYKKAGRYQNF